MDKCIKPEQWSELDEKEQNEFWMKVGVIKPLPSDGDIIVFLGKIIKNFTTASEVADGASFQQNHKNIDERWKMVVDHFKKNR